MACDSLGLGVVLSHLLVDGTEKPIIYIYRTLTSAERNYSQIEKESLPIVYLIKKSFTDFSLGILSEEKRIPTLASSRMQRRGTILAGHNQH